MIINETTYIPSRALYIKFTGYCLETSLYLTLSTPLNRRPRSGYITYILRIYYVYYVCYRVGHIGKNIIKAQNRDAFTASGT